MVRWIELAVAASINIYIALLPPLLCNAYLLRHVRPRDMWLRGAFLFRIYTKTMGTTIYNASSTAPAALY